ncbi:MAG: hypothetical protein R3B09_34400, partial [Nannocystaceae bacterium]
SLALMSPDAAHDQQRAGPRFLLARALRMTGRDPERARALAEEARASWGHWPGYYKVDLEAVDAWLAAPAAPSSTPSPKRR